MLAVIPFLEQGSMQAARHMKELEASNGIIQLSDSDRRVRKPKAVLDASDQRPQFASRKPPPAAAPPGAAAGVAAAAPPPAPTPTDNEDTPSHPNLANTSTAPRRRPPKRDREDASAPAVKGVCRMGTDEASRWQPRSQQIALLAALDALDGSCAPSVVHLPSPKTPEYFDALEVPNLPLASAFAGLPMLMAEATEPLVESGVVPVPGEQVNERDGAAPDAMADDDGEAVDAEGGRAWLLASWAPAEAQMGAAASLPSALAMPPLLCEQFSEELPTSTALFTAPEAPPSFFTAPAYLGAPYRAHPSFFTAAAAAASAELACGETLRWDDDDDDDDEDDEDDEEDEEDVEAEALPINFLVGDPADPPTPPLPPPSSLSLSQLQLSPAQLAAALSAPGSLNVRATALSAATPTTAPAMTTAAAAIAVTMPLDALIRCASMSLCGRPSRSG